MTEPLRSYSSMPRSARRAWIVPRWLKEAFVAFAVIAIAAVIVSKAVQHFGGKLNRAVSALDADELRIVPAPAFSLPDRDGKPMDLSAWRGKVVLLNFWATWCPPCREEEPSLRKLATAMDPGNFQLVAVSVDEGGWPEVDKFFSGNPPPYAVALDQAGRTSQTYGANQLPQTYLIDPAGNLRFKFSGPRNWMDPSVFTLLASLGAAKRD